MSGQTGRSFAVYDVAITKLAQSKQTSNNKFLSDNGAKLRPILAARLRDVQVFNYSACTNRITTWLRVQWSYKQYYGEYPQDASGRFLAPCLS